VLGSSGTENTLKASGDGFFCRLGWISERPELPTLNLIEQRERVPPNKLMWSNTRGGARSSALWENPEFEAVEGLLRYRACSRAR
jgi:hypothetical protein